MKTLIVALLILISIDAFSIEKQVLIVDEKGDTTKFSYENYKTEAELKYEEALKKIEIERLSDEIKNKEEILTSKQQQLRSQKSIIYSMILGIVSLVLFGLLILFIVLYAIAKKKLNRMNV